MKLLYLHQYFLFPDEPGGTRSYDLAKALTKKGIKIEVITTTSNEKYSEKKWTIVDKDGIKVHYIYLPYNNRYSYLKRIFVFIKFLWYASLKIISLPCDCVLATSTPLTIGIPALLKKLIHKTPFIFEVRDVWPEAVIAIGAIRNRLVKSALYKLEQLIYHHSSAIVTLSVDMKGSIVNRYPYLPKKKPVVVIENIAEIERFQNTHERIHIPNIVGFEPTCSILYAGTIGKVNGLSYLVELASQTIVLEPKLVYIIVGEGAEKEKIMGAALSRQILNKNFFVLNAVKKEELPMWYCSVDMGSSFVINIKELWANSANKFFDTLAAKKPILINHEGWQANQIRTSNIGYVLPAKLTAPAVENFVAYAKDRTKLASQAANALTVAKKHYSLAIATAKYIEVLNQISLRSK